MGNAEYMGTHFKLNFRFQIFKNDSKNNNVIVFIFDDG